MGAKGSAIALAAQAARIQTIGAARATLGYASEVLSKAWDGVGLIDVAVAIEGSAFDTAANAVFGITDPIKKELRDSIDIARAYVEGIYATYAGAGPDLLDQEISTLNSTRVALALQRSLTELNDVVDAIQNPPIVSGEEFIEGIKELLDKVVTKVAEAAAGIVQGAANAAATVIGAFAVPIAVVGGAVVLFWAWRAGYLGGGA